eukprot:13808920-Heterocapsa_arctica.AAC.1
MLGSCEAQLTLALVRLEYVDDDADKVGQLLRAAREGAVDNSQTLLRLPVNPDCCLDGDTALTLASYYGRVEVA